MSFKVILFIISAVFLFLLLPGAAVQAAANDILVYYTTDENIIEMHPIVGFNATIMVRAAADELTPALLSGYGQVWIIDVNNVYADLTPAIDFTPAEVAAIGVFRNAGGGLMFSALQTQGQDRANQLARQFNNGNNIYAGNLVVHTPPPVLTCINSAGLLHLTWAGYPTIHPLYLGLDPFHLTTRMNDTALSVDPLSGIEITAKVLATLDDYGAVLDDGAGGRIVFDNCRNRFMIGLGGCTAAQETQYQQNIADWLAGGISPCSWIDDNCGDAPCSMMEMHQTCGPLGCTGNCAGGFSQGDTQCVLDLVNCGAVCPDGSCDFPETSIVDFGFEILCLEDCGCDNDTFCEAERGENLWNCALDCTVVAADCLCQENAKDSGGESLVPCGRNFDDRDTVSICECCPCTFCHTFLLMKRITDFAVKRGLPAILVLAVMIAGALYLLGGFSGAFISKANDMFKIMGIGTAVIFAGWIVINIALYTITGNQTGSGVAQVFAGRWDEISCGYGVTCSTARCGDGIVQRPNFNGLDEECETDERWEGYKARAKAGEAIDTDGTVGANVIFGDIDETDYWNTVNSCDEGSCLIGAPLPPPPPPPNPNILVYYTHDNLQWTPEIYQADLTALGFSVTIMTRAGVDELTPALLSTYGQVWVINNDDNLAGISFSAAEVAAIGAFRSSGGGLMFSGWEQNIQQDRVNELARQFNSGGDIFSGDQIYCIPPPWSGAITDGGDLHLTWAGYPTIHPLYLGAPPFKLTAYCRNAAFSINPASGIEVTAKIDIGAIPEPYGAVLDDGLGGRIVFSPCIVAFTLPIIGLQAPAVYESLYQQNIAQWLD